MTQSELKTLVTTGIAVDITNWTFKQINDLIKETLVTIGYSTGINGVNGCLKYNTTTGILHVVTSRSSTLFQVL